VNQTEPYARRAAALSTSGVRALFAVAARPDVISLAGGMPFVGALPREEVIAAITKVIAERGDVALQYGGGAGLDVLKPRLAELMAEEGVSADPEAILITAGAQQALDLLGKLFIDPGDLVAVEGPSYVGALSAFSAYEPRFLPLPTDDDGLMVESLEQALADGARPRFLYTCPTFQNPSGVTLSADRRHRLVSVCRDSGIPIVEDNAYGLLRFEGQAPPTLRTLDPTNVTYVGTLSKVFCPGIRVGWILAEPPLLGRLTRFKEGADLCSSNLTQLVAEEWLSDPERWRSSLRALVATYRARRDACLAALERWFPPDTEWTTPAGGFYVWVTLPEGFDTTAMLARAVERRVAYVPGAGFYPDGSGRNRLRLAFCYAAEDAIDEGVRRLGGLVAEELARAPAGAGSG
jgi:2-aminoadipate transaminase